MRWYYRSGRPCVYSDGSRSERKRYSKPLHCLRATLCASSRFPSRAGESGLPDQKQADLQGFTDHLQKRRPSFTPRYNRQYLGFRVIRQQFYEIGLVEITGIAIANRLAEPNPQAAARQDDHFVNWPLCATSPTGPVSLGKSLPGNTVNPPRGSKSQSSSDQSHVCPWG